LGEQCGFAKSRRGGEERERDLHALRELLDQVGAADELCAQAGYVELSGQPHILRAMRERRQGFPARMALVMEASDEVTLC
jgi:hypothetical protein